MLSTYYHAYYIFILNLGDKIMKLLFCPLWLIIMSTVCIAVPLSDFFDYNRVGNYCNSSGISANDDLRRSDCDAILFLEEIDYEVLFILDIRFPFLMKQLEQ